MTRKRKAPRKKNALDLFDWLELRWCTNKRIDGLWIGTGEREPERVLRRVQAALGLIKAYDRLRYDRLIRDVARVWVRVVPHGLGTFNEPIKACELDTRFVLAETSSAEAIASTIVHEATHARLLGCGIGYEDEIPARVETVCFRRELAFAAKLPNGEQVLQSVERTLQSSSTPGFWTDTTFNERVDEGRVEALRHLGAPDWLVRTALAVRTLRQRICSLIRGPTRS